MSDFYQLSATTLQGQPVDFSCYRGKVVLIVNTASKCGFTPQYAGLQKLYDDYSQRGLVILGFPCNQFGQQEPGDAQVIQNGCLINYGVSFPIFAKCDVNGPAAHPVFLWLTRHLPGWFGRRVKWNFTKFLIGRNGEPIRRFAPTVKPEAMTKAIENALNKA